MTNYAVKSLLFLLVLLPQAAQRSVPVGEEPRHHVVFSNEYVRVIDAIVPAGDTTLFHTHSEDNVPVAIAGGKMRVEVLGGKTSESDVPMGGVWFAKASYTHQITNVGQTTLRFVDAEILRSPGGATSAPPLAGVPGMVLEIENDRVRIYRVKLAPGRSTGEHAHGRAGLAIAITSGKVTVASDGKRESFDLAAGDFHWRDGAGSHALENAGDSAFEAVEIEWK